MPTLNQQRFHYYFSTTFLLPWKNNVTLTENNLYRQCTRELFFVMLQNDCVWESAFQFLGILAVK